MATPCRRWEAIQFELSTDRIVRTKRFLPQVSSNSQTSADSPYRDSDGEDLARTMRSWQPFPDTRPALEQVLGTAMKLAILSNTNRDSIAHLLKHLEIPFHVVVTAEDCGSYKPSSPNFRQLLEVLETPPDEVIHGAFGFKYDVRPANHAGMQTAWINRHTQPLPSGGEPDFVWQDLSGLAALCGGEGPGIP